PGVPTDADALAGLPPPRDVLPHGVDHTDHLVPRDAREGDAGPLALLGKDVAVADAASLDLDPHGPWSRVGDRALDELEEASPGLATRILGHPRCLGRYRLFGSLAATALALTEGSLDLGL